MLVAFSVTPLGVGEAVAGYVADAVRVVRDSGLPNRTDAMFTTVEGDWDEVMDVVKRAVEAVAAKSGNAATPPVQRRPSYSAAHGELAARDAIDERARPSSPSSPDGRTIRFSRT